MWTPRRVDRSLRAMLLATLLLLGGTGMAAAADWVAASVRGTVLLLIGDKWQEIAVGQVLPSPAMMRTLGSGRLTVETDGMAFALGGGTALRLEQTSASPTLTHLAGTLAFAVVPPNRMVIATPSGAITTGDGRGRVTITGAQAVLDLDTGSATARDAGGEAINLDGEQSVDLGTGGRSEAARDQRGRPADAPGNGGSDGTVPGHGRENGNAGGNSGNGNAGGDANGSGNSGGSGNPNSGGTGNSGNTAGGNAASGKESSSSRGKGSGGGGEKSDNGKKGD